MKIIGSLPVHEFCAYLIQSKRPLRGRQSKLERTMSIRSQYVALLQIIDSQCDMHQQPPMTTANLLYNYTLAQTKHNRTHLLSHAGHVPQFLHVHFSVHGSGRLAHHDGHWPESVDAGLVVSIGAREPVLISFTY